MNEEIPEFHAEPMPTVEQYRKGLRLVSYWVLKSKLKELTKWMERGEWGYDIGAGMGQYTKALNKMGYHVLAVEPLTEYDETAQHLKAEEIRESRDYAYLINVLHHAENPVEMLKHLKTICPKLIISETNRRNPIVRLFIKIFLRWEAADGQLDGLEVRTMLFLAGWEVKEEYATSLFGIPFVYNWFVCKRP